MRYRRQGFEIPIELAADELAGRSTSTALVERFDEVHHRLYGFGLEGGAEIVNLRVDRPRPRPGARAPARTRSARGSVDGADAAPSACGRAARSTRRPHLRARRARRAGMRIAGYAIVEQYDATTVVLPGHVARRRPVAEPADRARGG